MADCPWLMCEASAGMGGKYPSIASRGVVVEIQVRASQPALARLLCLTWCVQEHEATEDTFKTVYLFKVVVSTKLRRWVTRKRFSQFEQLWLQVL